MYQYKLVSNKKEFANTIIEEANKILANSPFLFRSLNENDSIEKGLYPLTNEPREHDAYDHVRDGNLETNLISFSKGASCPFTYFTPNGTSKIRIAVCDTSEINNEIIEAQNLPEFVQGKGATPRNWAISSMEYLIRGEVLSNSLQLLYEEKLDDISSFKDITNDSILEYNTEYTRNMGKFVSYFKSRFDFSTPDAASTFNFIMGKSKEQYNSKDQSTVLKAVFTVIATDYTVSTDPVDKAFFKDLYCSLAQNAECRVRYNQINEFDLSDNSLYEFTTFFSKLKTFIDDYKNCKKIGAAILNEFIPENLPSDFTLLKSDKMNDLYIIRNNKGEYSLPFTIDNRKRYSETLSAEIKELTNCYEKCYQKRVKLVEKNARNEYKKIISSQNWKNINGLKQSEFFYEFFTGFIDYCEAFDIKDNSKAIDTLNSYISMRGYDLSGGKICECNYNENNNILKMIAFPDKISLPFLCNNLTKTKDLKKDFTSISDVYKRNYESRLSESQKNTSTFVSARNFSSRMKM